MPLYTYHCLECHAEQANFRTIAQRNASPTCERGHDPRKMGRKIEAPSVAGDFAPYDCPVTGRTISGRREHEANLRRHGARVLEPGESQAVMRKRERESADLERRIGDTVDAEIAAMPNAKREKLASEMEAGVSVTPTRATGKAPHA